jgi:threonine aldolase
MSAYKRRDFLKLSSLSALPLIASAAVPINTFAAEQAGPSKDSEAVYFINDGIFYRPEDFINKLQEINTSNPIERDSYGEGGAMEKLLSSI